MVDSILLIRYNLQILIWVWVDWQLLIKTAKSQPHLIFRRFSTVYISDFIFSAVHAALSLHIQKKKEEECAHVVYEGEKSPETRQQLRNL